MAMPGFPDPVLSANIYCAGRLDLLIEQAIAPFWREMRREPAAESSYLWLLRYDLRGEHLKIRVHGPADLEPFFEASLRRAVEPFLQRLPPAEPRNTSEPALPGLRPPAIDVEDGDPGRPPDLSFLPTTYRRHMVSLGDRPHLGDDAYVAHLTHCLGRGCDEILEAALGEGGLAARRQIVAWQLLLLALAALADRPESRAAYLDYHRDWLIRFPLLKANIGAKAGRELISRFEAIGATRQGQRAFLSSWAAESWKERLGDGAAPFTAAVAGLLAAAAPLASRPAGRLDPFAAEPYFPVLFKLLHGLANQLGLSRMDEAVLVHELLRASSPEPVRPESFSILPGRAPEAEPRLEH